MTAQIIAFCDDWTKSITQVAATGRITELWEFAEGNRRASITRCANGNFRWRVYVAVKHRTPRYRQKFRPICDVHESDTLTDAKTAARAFVSTNGPSLAYA